MIIPRHKICDLCGQEVGINVRYYIINSKCLYVRYAGSCYDNKKHHICEDCIGEIRDKILRDNREGDKEKLNVDPKIMEYTEYIKEQQMGRSGGK